MFVANYGFDENEDGSKVHLETIMNNTIKIILRVLVCFSQMTAMINCTLANEVIHSTVGSTYSHREISTYPDNVYWGDTHLHTNLSWDAYNSGNKNLGPEQAYRFAKGESVTAHNGMTAKLRRPLDFLVVADHASNMGVMQGLEKSDRELLNGSLGREWASVLKEIKRADASEDKIALRLSSQLSIDGFIKGSVATNNHRQSVWKKVTALADSHNAPGQFTAFIGYEWTQIFYNLHRVVIFKDGAERAGEVLPFSQYDSSDPEDLWAYLENYERQTAGEVLAIPHNGNLSPGIMFALEGADGQVMSADYAKARSRWEPLFEATQIKGDSETHPALSNSDEFANYEKIFAVVPSKNSWPEVTKRKITLNHYDSWVTKNLQGKDDLWIHRYGYARSGLKLGLRQQAKIGVNPFKFGMIGSTDSHTSLATADEDNFWGKMSWTEPYPGRLQGSWNGAKGSGKSLAGFWGNAWRMNAAGYAAVWAEENTRESLFAAMKRKEVYASTGPRITVRFFGGWDYQPDDALKPDLARIGYEKGVPMGGDLTSRPDTQSPTFLIRAVKDPDGANLDRVQVIKGWHDKKGELYEKIYDVALSDDRKVNWRGKVKPVGNTVDIPDASYTNTIGDPELAVVWQDPDFDKDDLAFYYVRVLEIPTPRWTAFDAKFFGVENIPEEVPMITQERAYTSPIWYSPTSKHQ